MIRRVLGLIALAGGVAVVACSTETASDPYPTVDSFCSAKANIECKDSAALCGVTADACKGARTQACHTLANGAVGRTYTPSSAQDCLDKTTAVYADRVVNKDKETAATDACNRVFAGTKNKADACTGLYDCTSSLVCDKGFCADKVEKQPNDGCSNAGEVCTSGYYCQQNGSQSFCKPDKNQGEPCSAKDPCNSGLRCVNTCIPLAASGEACDTSNDCATTLCDPTSKKCIARQYASETGTCKDFGAF